MKIGSLVSTILFGLCSITPTFAQPNQSENLTGEENEYILTPPEISSESDILLVGDSLAVGLSTQFHKLAKQSGYKPHTHAIVGSTTNQWIKLLKSDLKKIEPKLVIVSLGTNDSTMSPEWFNIHQNIFSELTKIVIDSGVKIIWIMPPSLQNKNFKSQNLVIDLIKKTDSMQFDSTQLEIPRSKDKVHPTIKGYQLWMDSIWWWLADNNIIYEGC